jgi:hypothetical protein
MSFKRLWMGGKMELSMTGLKVDSKVISNKETLIMQQIKANKSSNVESFGWEPNPEPSTEPGAPFGTLSVTFLGKVLDKVTGERAPGKEYLYVNCPEAHFKIMSRENEDFEAGGSVGKYFNTIKKELVRAPEPEEAPAP